MSPAPWSDANSGLLQAVYELLCISRMNAIYCEGRLREIQRISFWMEILIAATASGSGLASFGVFSTTYGQAVWQGLSLSAAVIAIVRPIYAPAKKLELLTRQQHGYQANFFLSKSLLSSYGRKGQSQMRFAVATKQYLIDTHNYQWMTKQYQSDAT